MKKKFLKLFILIILIILLSVFVICLLNNKIMPLYLSYAEEEMKKVVTTVINKSVTEDLTDRFNTDDFFIIKIDEVSRTTIVDFDPVILNRAMSEIANLVYDNLKLISEKDKDALEKFNMSDSVFYIPSGLIFDTVWLNNLGPKIPVKMELVSSVNPNIETKVTEYGINNSLIEVFIHVIADVKMVLPTASKTIQITVVVPLAVKIIQGMVPDYYLGSFFQEKNS